MDASTILLTRIPLVLCLWLYATGMNHIYREEHREPHVYDGNIQFCFIMICVWYDIYAFLFFGLDDVSGYVVENSMIVMATRTYRWWEISKVDFRIHEFWTGMLCLMTELRQLRIWKCMLVTPLSSRWYVLSGSVVLARSEFLLERIDNGASGSNLVDEVGQYLTLSTYQCWKFLKVVRF